MDSNDFVGSHSKMFKNEGKSFENMRRDRQNNVIELRKNRRDDLIQKKRNEQIAPVEIGSKKPESIPRTLQEIDALVQNCASPNPEIYHQAILNLRVYLSNENVAFMEHLLKRNIIQILINRIGRNEPVEVRYNSAWALTNIASGPSEQTRYLLNPVVISALEQTLCEFHPNLVEQAIWALSNMIGDGPEARACVLALNLLKILPTVLVNFHDNFNVLKQFSWMMINICRKKEKSEVHVEYLCQIIPILLQLLDIPDEPVQSDTLWAVTHLADSSSNHISLMIQGGVIEKVFLFFNRSPKLALSALRACGNVAASIDEHTQYIIDRNIYQYLMPLFMTENNKIKKEVYWLLSNIAAGTKPQMHTLFSLNIFPQIIKDLECGEHQVQREACWIISNVMHSCDVTEARPFIQSRVLFFMNRFLCGNDVNMIIVVLEVIVIILRVYTANNELDFICSKVEESGALDSIESLQTHSNKSVCNYSNHILETYFAEDKTLSDDSSTNISSENRDAKASQYPGQYHF